MLHIVVLLISVDMASLAVACGWFPTKCQLVMPGAVFPITVLFSLKFSDKI